MEDNNEKVIRHSGMSRLFHWIMAASILVLLFTGLSPVLGIQFEWIEPHWISGVALTVAVLIHIVRSLSLTKLKSMKISPSDVKEFIENGGKVRGGKYSLEQKLMHLAIMVLSLVSLFTGWLMLLKIDTPFWERNPFIFEAGTWGILYVLHGISTLVFVSSVMMHIYFSLRPEKAMYLRSMFKGWMTREEFEKNHDKDRWNV